MASIVDPPFIEPHPDTVNQLAKRIVRKSIKAKQPKTNLRSVEAQATKLYDSLQSSVLGQLNEIENSLFMSKSANREKLAAARASIAKAKLAVSEVMTHVGQAQSSIRHTYTAPPAQPRYRRLG